MRTLGKIAIGLVAAMMVLTLSAIGVGKEGKEGKKKEEIKLGDRPAAIQETIKANAGGGQIIEVEKMTKKGGSVVYEAELKQTGGKKIEVKVAADGKLIKVEDEEENNQKDEDKDDRK